MGKKSVLITLVILVLVVGVLSFLNGAGKDRDPEMIYIMKNGQMVKSITMSDVQALPQVKKEIILNSSEGREEHLFTGTPLKELILSIDAALLDGAKQVISKSVDGYTVSFDMSEVLEEDKVLLVYAQDGKSLGSKSDGGTGPFRIIVPYDQFAQRAGKYVQELEVR